MRDLDLGIGQPENEAPQAPLVKKITAPQAPPVKMVAPQAPLVKNGGAAGATKWNAAPQALLDSNCAQRNANRQDTLVFS